jgi:hypothetical protein
MTEVWSCGGGVQSAAIAALICQGRLPKPDLAVIVDTEREKSSTWSYLDEVLRPNLAKVGVGIERIRKSDFTDVDLWGGEDDKILLIPAFTTLNGSIGKKPAFCSGEWKRDVIHRFLRSKGIEEARTWIGISLNEKHRIRAQRKKWVSEWYPLIFEVPMGRGDCIRLVMDGMKWPRPPRSSCWMCPNMSDDEWREMSEEDMAKAVEFEREIRKQDGFVYLHQLGKPLDQVDFTDRQQTLYGCESGYCFV